MPLKLRKTFSGCLWLLILLPGFLNAQKRNDLKPKVRLLRIVDKSLQESAKQYRFLIKGLGPGRFPVTYYATKKKLITTGSEPWVGGFYPGALLYLYEATGDTSLFHESLRKLDS